MDKYKQLKVNFNKKFGMKNQTEDDNSYFTLINNPHYHASLNSPPQKTQDNNTPKPSFIEELYSKYADNIENYYKHNKKNITLYGSAIYDNTLTNDLLSKIKDDQDNVIKGLNTKTLKYRNLTSNGNESKRIPLTPLPKNTNANNNNNTMLLKHVKDDLYKAERKVVVMRQVEYTRVTVDNNSNNNNNEQHHKNINNNNNSTTNAKELRVVKRNKQQKNKYDKMQLFLIPVMLIQKWWRRKLAHKKIISNNNDNDIVNESKIECLNCVRDKNVINYMKLFFNMYKWMQRMFITKLKRNTFDKIVMCFRKKVIKAKKRKCKKYENEYNDEYLQSVKRIQNAVKRMIMMKKRKEFLMLIKQTTIYEEYMKNNNNNNSSIKKKKKKKKWKLKVINVEDIEIKGNAYNTNNNKYKSMLLKENDMFIINKNAYIEYHNDNKKEFKDNLNQTENDITLNISERSFTKENFSFNLQRNDNNNNKIHSNIIDTNVSNINFIKQITYSNVDVQVNIKAKNVIDCKNNYFEITSIPKQFNVIQTQTEFNSNISVYIVEPQNITIELCNTDNKYFQTVSALERQLNTTQDMQTTMDDISTGTNFMNSIDINKEMKRKENSETQTITNIEINPQVLSFELISSITQNHIKPNTLIHIDNNTNIIEYLSSLNKPLYNLSQTQTTSLTISTSLLPSIAKHVVNPSLSTFTKTIYLSYSYNISLLIYLQHSIRQYLYQNKHNNNYSCMHPPFKHNCYISKQFRIIPNQINKTLSLNESTTNMQFFTSRTISIDIPNNNNHNNNNHITSSKFNPLTKPKLPQLYLNTSNISVTPTSSNNSRYHLLQKIMSRNKSSDSTLSKRYNLNLMLNMSQLSKMHKTKTKRLPIILISIINKYIKSYFNCIKTYTPLKQSIYFKKRATYSSQSRKTISFHRSLSGTYINGHGGVFNYGKIENLCNSIKFAVCWQAFYKVVLLYLVHCNVNLNGNKIVTFIRKGICYKYLFTLYNVLSLNLTENYVEEEKKRCFVKYMKVFDEMNNIKENGNIIEKYASDFNMNLNYKGRYYNNNNNNQINVNYNNGLNNRINYDYYDYNKPEKKHLDYTNIYTYNNNRTNQNNSKRIPFTIQTIYK
jgi:hypothetical protein